MQVSSLLDEKNKDVLIEDVAEEYQEIREEYYETLKVTHTISCRYKNIIILSRQIDVSIRFVCVSNSPVRAHTQLLLLTFLGRLLVIYIIYPYPVL